MKKIIIPTILILVFASCSACSSSGFFPKQMDIGKVTIVRIFAIDQGTENPDNIRVTIVIQSESESSTDSEGEQNISTILSCESESISSASRAMQEYVNKRLFYGHIDICLIGEQMAQRDIFGVMDFLSRDPEFRINSYLFLTKDSAMDFLVACNSKEFFLPEHICNIAENKTLLSSNHILRVQKVSSQLDDNDVSAIAVPMLSAVAKSDDKNQPLMNAPIMEIAAYAIIKDGRLVGHLEKENMLGYNITTGNIKFPIIDVETDDGIRIALEVVRGKTKIIPKTKDDVLTGIVIRTEIHANINEIMQTGVSLDKKMILDLEDKLKTALTEHTVCCIRTAQSLNADFIEIGNTLLHKKPSVWHGMKDCYNDVFPFINITVEITPQIDRTYDTRNPVGGQKSAGGQSE